MSSSRTFPRKPRHSSAARTQDSWITSQISYHRVLQDRKTSQYSLTLCHTRKVKSLLNQYSCADPDIFLGGVPGKTRLVLLYDTLISDFSGCQQFTRKVNVLTTKRSPHLEPLDLILFKIYLWFVFFNLLFSFYSFLFFTIYVKYLFLSYICYKQMLLLVLKLTKD